MIQPDFDLLMWIILISFGIDAIARIIAGAIHMKKETEYTTADAFVGLTELFLVVWVAFK